MAATNDPVSQGVAGRYASALFDLARDQGQLIEVEKDLTTFRTMLDESGDLRLMVRSPVISRHEQSKALAALASKAGLGVTVGNFLGVVARSGRLFAIEDMIKAFHALAARERGEVQAEVTSAVALNDVQIAQLKDTLKATVGKDVQLAMRVDPAILGGLVVKVGSRMVDSSIRTKLAGLRMAMTG